MVMKVFMMKMMHDLERSPPNPINLQETRVEESQFDFGREERKTWD